MQPMTGLRKSILFMIVHLAIVFNIERLNYGGQDVIDIQSYVYVVILIAITATLVSRLLHRFSIYFGITFWIGIYGALKLFVFNARPLLGGVYTYLSITEVSLLSISVFLANDLARALADFESVIEKVTFPKHGQRVMDMKAATEDVKTEFVRSRRHNRPLSVLVLEMDPSSSKVNQEKTIFDLQKSMLNRYLLTSLAQILSKEARRTDLIIEQDDREGFVLLCPETTTTGSYTLAERIQNLALERLGISVNCGVASFPDEALTFEDLLQKAKFSMLAPEKLLSVAYREAEDQNEK